MKIVITGVSGLFDAHVSRYLLDKGHEVIGIEDCSGCIWTIVCNNQGNNL